MTLQQTSFDFDDKDSCTNLYDLDRIFSNISANSQIYTVSSGAISGTIGAGGGGGYNVGNGAVGSTGLYNQPIGTNGPNYNTGGYYLPGNITYPNITLTDHAWYTNSSNALDVKGDANFEGDVKIKGKSISEALDKIEQRLALLTPNNELEGKWDELKELGNRYRELEKEILEKQKMWDILKK